MQTRNPSPSVGRTRRTHIGGRHFLARPWALVLAFLVLGPIPTCWAETILFDAQVEGTTPRPEPCPDGAFICGTATIAGIGSGEYRFFLTSLNPVPDACVDPSGSHTGGAYTATITFSLGDGSQLTLSEVGVVCGPGLSLTAPGGARSFGNPVDGSGKWEVKDATGQFAGLTGEGTDDFHSAGAQFRAAYIATLKR